MKIVISHCNKYDFLNELYIPIKKDYKLSSHNIYLPEENRAVNTKEIINAGSIEYIPEFFNNEIFSHNKTIEAPETIPM